MSVHVTLGDTTYQYPNATGWGFAENGTLTISTNAEGVVVEQGVYAAWDAVYDPDDCKVVVRDTPCTKHREQHTQ